MGEIIRSYFTLNGHQFRVVQFRGGMLEVYAVESDGMETFKGYTHQVHIDLAEAAWDAFQTAPGQRWLLAC